MTDRSETKPRVSVILTILNEEAGLGALLDSILGQSLPPDEVIIVDGGSTDSTPDVVADYSSRFRNIKFLVEPGVNIARGRNIAISHASGDIMAVTDGGCRPDHDWLTNLIAPFLEDPSISAVAGQIVPESRSKFEYYAGQLSTPDSENELQRTMFYGRSSAFTRVLWEVLGGYPEWLYTAEDSLFALRARALGFKVARSEKSLLHWYPRPNLRKTIKMFYLYGRGNGRIDWGSTRGSFYWLRYHALWAFTLVLGLFYPWALLLTAATLGFLYREMLRPSIKRLRKRDKDLALLFYVPLIVFSRNIATNLGFLYGKLEYRYDPLFRVELKRYTATTNPTAEHLGTPGE